MHQDLHQMTPMDAFATLQWYVEAGVDEAWEDTSVDWFALSPMSQAPSRMMEQPALLEPIKPAPHVVAVPAYISQGQTSLIDSAKEAAGKCQTIEALRDAVLAFEGCALKKLASRTVFADGNPEANVMVIGEAPGADEDREGIPFCGVSGKLLDRMLASIGLDRVTNAYITNSVFWRPPGNRTPSTDELDICRPFVERHIALVKPDVLVLVGGAATKSVLQTNEGITRLRTRMHSYSNGWLDVPIATFSIFHPSYLLRQPGHKAYAWKDLLAIKAFLD